MTSIVLKFTPAPPPTGRTFSLVGINGTDGGGGAIHKQFTAAEIAAQSVAQPDGSYLMTVDLGQLAVGPFSVTAQGWGTDSSPMGPAITASGNVSLADGVWYPQPVSLTIA